ncbi:MAG: hypothetical protein R3F11_06695 [Verrucomicrobiales bacterium]
MKENDAGTIGESAARSRGNRRRKARGTVDYQAGGAAVADKPTAEVRRRIERQPDQRLRAFLGAGRRVSPPMSVRHQPGDIALTAQPGKAASSWA